MHELSIAQSIVETVTERTGRDPVVLIHLEIGRLSGVDVDAIRFCFDLVTAGTPAEGAELLIDEPPGRARCRVCGTAFEPVDPLLGCACGSLDTEVTCGQQLRIQNVKVRRDVQHMRM